jgi:hypothetical protein
MKASNDNPLATAIPLVDPALDVVYRAIHRNQVDS